MDKIWLKNYHPNVPPELPPLNKKLVQHFEEVCQNYQNQTAFISFDKELSYKELKKQADCLAGYLQSQGFKKKDRIVIQLPNLLQYPISFWSAVLSGLTVVNMNPLYTASEMLGPVQESEAKGIILLSSCESHLQKIWHKTKLEIAIVTHPGDLLDFPKKQVINSVFRFKTGYQNKAPKRISFLKALEKGSKNQVQPVETDFKDTLLIQYTGGTTGTAKGACLSQKNILSNFKQGESWMLSTLNKGEERALAALPFSHIFAFLVNGLVFFLNAFPNILIANPRQIPSLIKTIKKQKPTVGTGVNTLFKALLKQPLFHRLDFSHWKLFIAGGMALESQVQKNWYSVTKSQLIEGYGLTEAAPIVSCNRLDKNQEGFAGLPLPSTQIRIVDEKGEELGWNQEGELEVKGPQVMKGYYKKPEETRLVLNEEGWLKTGDIAKLNSEGLIQIVDRKKDMINISGLKVFPNEVEEVLMSHPKIQSAVVIAEKNREGKEFIKAFVVKNTKTLNEKELKSHCKKYLAPYKIPKQIEFVKEIPKNLLGKPLRRLFKKS